MPKREVLPTPVSRATDARRSAFMMEFFLSREYLLISSKARSQFR